MSVCNRARLPQMCVWSYDLEHAVGLLVSDGSGAHIHESIRLRILLSGPLSICLLAATLHEGANRQHL
jgi:hypothetical protein